MSGKEEVSLRDEIASAFNSSNAKTETVDNTEVIDSLEPKEEKERDEQGRFAKKDEKPAEEVKVDAETPQAEAETQEADAQEEPDQQVRLSVEKAPSSWSPRVREQWAKLPEDVRAEIIRREEASAHGVRQLHESYGPVKQFAEALSPFIQEAAHHGQNPAQYIAGVMAAERSLRSQDPNQRFEALMNIADQYGIPLRQALNGVAGKEVVPTAPQQPVIPPQIAQELGEMKKWREEVSANQMKSEIESFKVGKEFFEDVADTMADLIESGFASGLQDAYDKACRMNDDVWDVIVSRKQDSNKSDALKQRQAAAAGATVKASGQADVDGGNSDDDSIEAAIRKSIKEVSGRT